MVAHSSFIRFALPSFFRPSRRSTPRQHAPRRSFRRELEPLTEELAELPCHIATKIAREVADEYRRYRRARDFTRR